MIFAYTKTRTKSPLPASITVYSKQIDSSEYVIILALLLAMQSMQVTDFKPTK